MIYLDPAISIFFHMSHTVKGRALLATPNSRSRITLFLKKKKYSLVLLKDNYITEINDAIKKV